MASSGNFCMINPLVESDSTLMNGTLSDGNVKYASSGDDGWVCNMAMTGKTYCEVRIDALSNFGGTIGFRSMTTQSQVYDAVTFQANYSSGYLYHYIGTSGQSNPGNIGGTVSSGSIVMMAYDPDTYKWWVGVNGTWRNSGNPANGTGYVFQGSASMFEDMSAITWGGWKGGANGITVTYNFGQDSTFGGQETAGGNADDNGFGDFKYAPPTGFLALCTGNLSVSDDIDPAQTDSDYPKKQFSADIFTGNGGTQTIQLGDSFKPDCVWMKNRGTANSWIVLDSTRGYNKTLKTDDSSAESTDAYVGYGIESDFFDSTGIKANGGGSPAFNASGGNYTVQGWRANGGTTSSNTNGSITSTVQANQAAGFSVITYTGTGSNATIGHGLSSAPDFFMTKDRGRAENWAVYHSSRGATKYLTLNTNATEYANSNRWNDTEPTSTVFSLGTNDNVNGSSANYVAYAWHNVEGYQKFGSYEGNGNTDGPFIYTGFRPRLIFFKRTGSAGNWEVRDTARDTFNPIDSTLLWDSNGAEVSHSVYYIDVLSNGVKIRTTSANYNTSGNTYIYGAWGDVPFKYNNTF